MTDAPASAAPRRRDPDRRQRILTAAAELVAERGYHEVGMSDIGAAAGIVGSGIYRHFDGKSAVLVAMFDRVIDDLTAAAAEILSRRLEPARTLRELIAAHVRITLEDRMLMRVYHNEIASLPAEDNRRLRRKQRIYIEEWVHILDVLRPEVDDHHAGPAGGEQQGVRPADAAAGSGDHDGATVETQFIHDVLTCSLGRRRT